MCGIFGAYGVSLGDCSLPDIFNALGRRGPDDSGYSVDASSGVVMAHTRLAIHDLTASGHQPMSSFTGKFEIVFNGEIYNYNELKTDLVGLGHTFLGVSDTEVMLCCFEEYGIHASLQKFTGMFAFSVIDRSSDMLYLARDRMGEKPLYYHLSETSLTWGSNVLALKGVRCLNMTVSRKSLAMLLRYKYIPSPNSIYNEVHKLQAGGLLSVNLNKGLSSIKEERYWSLEASLMRPNLYFETDSEAVDTLSNLVDKAVGGQMQADVPLGAFLSGGVDSSLVVAVMQRLSNRKINTYSLGFEDENYNEAPFAKAVANHLETDHTEYIVSSKDALNVVPQLSSIYDEPFADSSQIPTFLVSKMAKKSVTVALSGDGGDELFYGYSRYSSTMRKYNIFNNKSYNAAGYLLGRLPCATRSSIQRITRGRITSRKIKMLAESLSCNSIEDMYNMNVSANLDADSFVLGVSEGTSVNSIVSTFSDKHDSGMSLNDMLTYLPDDILVKVDRAAMAVSLETRTPLLDKDIVQFALSLPMSYKVRGGQGKWLLRQLLYRYVPRKLIERPKKGFSIPLGVWLRTDLRDWAESLLQQEDIMNAGLFDVVLVRSLWMTHLQGVDMSTQLWPILMANDWLKNN